MVSSACTTLSNPSSWSFSRCQRRVVSLLRALQPFDLRAGRRQDLRNRRLDAVDPLGRRADPIRLLGDSPGRRGKIGLVSRRARELLLQVLQQGENPPLDRVGRRDRPVPSRPAGSDGSATASAAGGEVRDGGDEALAPERRGFCLSSAGSVPSFGGPNRRLRSSSSDGGGSFSSWLVEFMARSSPADMQKARQQCRPPRHLPIRVTRTPGRPTRRQNNTHRR